MTVQILYLSESINIVMSQYTLNIGCKGDIASTSWQAYLFHVKQLSNNEFMSNYGFPVYFCNQSISFSGTGLYAKPHPFLERFVGQARHLRLLHNSQNLRQIWVFPFIDLHPALYHLWAMVQNISASLEVQECHLKLQAILRFMEINRIIIFLCLWENVAQGSFNLKPGFA